ncbi:MULTISPECIES: O-antigen polymerase [unclassified Streptomyces]|uniref:O-antigen polymerase n=1 Tax=unclassified Streptomyces TaxID=2593676 RepID=UPI002DD7E474|nr:MULTISPECIES: O-antigen polymerase [unclassified Streptomyces]WSA95091.1 oligosaccharide repeat unit polymerase [Streptomyces sp. NBC_01795]WSB79512.1 oligosaccharide repeat unit polymerase [Streptomyces sp. NBC_01775]WSS40997.1 oligosaccharide repeat unit polymerase [Streptomyces sp. NBC_01187]
MTATDTWLARTAPRAVLSRALTVPLVIGLVAVLPGAVATAPGPGPHDTAYWLQLATCAYAGTRLAAMVLTARRRLIQSAFWLFVYIAMGVAPLAQTVLDATPTPVVGPRADTVLATALVLAGIVAFDVGALLARHRPPLRSRLHERHRTPATVHRPRLYVLVAVALVGSGLLVVQLGGPAVFFSNRQEISESVEGATAGAGAEAASEAGSAFLRGFGTVPALLALLFLTRWLVTSRAARRSPLVWLLWLAMFGLNAIVNNPVSNPRYWFLTVLFSLLFTAFPRSPVMYRASLALGVAIALVVFPFADKFRYEEGADRPEPSGSLLEPLTMKDYDQTGMLANTITFVGSGEGHSYGRQLTGTVGFFVPRSVWTGKPHDPGTRVGEWMGMPYPNLSSPLWAELWLDFGPLGMALGFAGVGYAASRVDRRYARRTEEEAPRDAAQDARGSGGSGGSGGLGGSEGPGSVLAVVVPLVAGYSFILLRGSLLQGMGRVGIAVVCVLLVTTFRGGRDAQPR